VPCEVDEEGVSRLRAVGNGECTRSLAFTCPKAFPIFHSLLRVSSRFRFRRPSPSHGSKATVTPVLVVRLPPESNLFSSSRCYFLSTSAPRLTALFLGRSRNHELTLFSFQRPSLCPPMYYGRFFFPHGDPAVAFHACSILPYVHSYSPSVPISRLFGFRPWCTPCIVLKVKSKQKVQKKKLRQDVVSFGSGEKRE
jgi:hypothetical protein